MESAIESQSTPSRGIADIRDSLSALVNRPPLGGQAADPASQVTLLEQLNLRLDTLASLVKDLSDVAWRSDRHIDELQAEKTKRWFQNGALMIASISLLFSFGTTAVTAYHTNQLDYQAARAELRTLLQRLSALPKENVEVLKNPDPFIAGQLSAAINSENLLLAKQAQEVMDKRLGNKNITATEYNLLASAFVQSGLLSDAEHELQYALRAANDLTDEATSLRGYGGLLFASGNIDGGRAVFARALGAHERYPNEAAAYVALTDAWTQVYWATSEAGQKQCDASVAHLTAASGVVAALPAGQLTTLLAQQIETAQQTLAACTRS